MTTIRKGQIRTRMSFSHLANHPDGSSSLLSSIGRLLRRRKSATTEPFLAFSEVQPMHVLPSVSAVHIGALLALRKVSTPTMLASLSVRCAALRLTELDRKAAMVVRADDTFCGVVCEASLIAAIARHHDAAFDQAIGDVASDRDVAYCSVRDSLSNALRRLSEEGRSFLVVTSRMRPIELVFRDELAEWCIRCRSA